uniref:Uncharacterized protein n=1 Tax=Anguilla anguilla TaxID=7936 RepID=A0A0E9WF38_ANGAN
MQGKTGLFNQKNSLLLSNMTSMNTAGLLSIPFKFRYFRKLPETGCSFTFQNRVTLLQQNIYQ